MKPMTLLITFCLVAPLGAAAQDSDPFAGDSRIFKKHTIKAAGIPLKELLEQLSKETGIQLTATNRVAEDKVVLYAHNRPVADSLRIIAKFFNFYWGRTGAHGAYSYTLSQSLKQQQAESQEIEADILRTADLVLAQAKQLQELSRLDPEELKVLAESLREKTKNMEESAEKRALQNKGGMAQMLVHAPYKAQVAGIITGLGRDGVLRILRGDTLEYAYPPAPGKRPLLPPAAESIMAGFKASHRSNTEREYNFASIRLSAPKSGNPELNASIRAGAKTTTGGHGSGNSLTLPNDREEGLSDQAPIEPENWRKIESLTRKVTLDLLWKEPRTESDRGRLPAPFLARAFSALEKNLPVDLISDAFFRGGGFPVKLRERPLGETLTYVCRSSQHRWTYASGFVQVKDRTYGVARAGEPSIFQLRRWAALNDEDLLSLNRLSEIASQSHVKFQTSLFVLSEAHGFEQWHEILSGRDHLLFWGALTPVQRSAAFTPGGLPFRNLTAPQKRMYLQASMNPGYREDEFTQAKRAEWNDESLSSASLTVTKSVQQMWGLRTADGGYTTSGSNTREMAIGSLRRNNPDFTESAVWDVQRPTYTFRYSAKNGEGLNALIHLPHVWSKPKAAPGAQKEVKQSP